ncbi:alpha/beta hydrolase, partial [Streptomyces sp. SID11233]|nr:alpha/beta hydrolase [Streptomyces sp. SID11233]
MSPEPSSLPAAAEPRVSPVPLARDEELHTRHLPGRTLAVRSV